MGIRLSPDEAWEMLAQSHTGILTTLTADGRPVTLPVWFTVLDHAICLQTPRSAKKLSRIRRDPRASFLVETGELWAELRAVHLSGEITEVDDPAQAERIAESIEKKYAAFRTPQQALPDATRDHYAQMAYLRFVPDPRMLTWDNRRITTRTG
ncbi:pyridoxamine 5'-phosphate oxidase family protein [Nocardia sp. alder85J]|uniref:pyridoxamine 5'-phosphate oxidase family protein n=1 Tax=Nocardia sp. alder85J TaxID=2862949 RepID=UPI001CD49437|nr:pyridoxamine 5'-phosphate oxidase family protein [Nocardia sp. alder85J]MCX4099014.1 pyridoxamine 5'-phosphate oxidase family protein [Nocardia sp. alder85J]